MSSTLVSSRPSSPRPWWVLVVVVIYLLLLAGLWFGVGTFVVGIWSDAGWGFLAVAIALLLAQTALLFFPFRFARRRPITKRTIWIPLLATGFLAGLLATGAAFALVELLRIERDYTLHLIIAGAAALWFGWAILFYLLARPQAFGRVSAALHRFLLAGSILELLIAVPCHLIVRRRTECCAGFLTGFGICTGLIVMLVAFGPAVALLYIQRWRQIQPPEDLARRGFPVEITQEQASLP